MRKNKEKVITIAALVIAVIGLSIGFAAFASTLNISTSARVTPTDTFSVKFSNLDTSLAVPSVLPTGNSTASGDTAPIDNSDDHNPVISNLSAHFTQPNQKVEYVFYVRNMGPYDAYLTDVRFNNVQGGRRNKKCTATSDNPVSDANAMCQYIDFKLELADSPSNKELTPSSNFASVVGNNYMVNKSTTPETRNTNSKLVKVTIEYPDGSPYADGSFDVDFGSVEMVFASLAGYIPPAPTPATSEQVAIDNLIPSEEQLAWDASEDEHVFINTDDIIFKYTDMSGYKYLQIYDKNTNYEYWWACDNITAQVLGPMLNIDMQEMIWYYSMDEGET